MVRLSMLAFALSISAMRKILIILAIVIFLYSPYGPDWGRFAVNAAIVLAIFSFCGKGMTPPPRYYDEEEYN